MKDQNQQKYGNMVIIGLRVNKILTIFEMLTISCFTQQNITITMSSNKTPEDLEFQAKLAKAFYKTTAKSIGQAESKLPAPRESGINGKFTDHLIYSGMYKNASLNTTADKDRWLNGSKDWMEHLG